MDYVTLMGSEQVQSAGIAMRHAAEEMNRAASSIDSSLTQHQRFLDDWLQRVEAILTASQEVRP